MNIVTRTILASPALKTVFSVVTMIFTGIFSGAFISEITINGVLIWNHFYHAVSFYILLIISFLIYYYHSSSYAYEKDIMKFADSEYCLAYVRSQCIPEAAQKYIENIRNGQGVGDLQQAMREVKKILE